MKKIVFKLEAGRVLTKNNVPVLMFSKTDNISPADADILAHRIVNALNHMEMIREGELK
jgi:hypothetical protein